MKQETKIRIQRLLSEGAVIVFAILLAFLIDAWWADRLLRNEESATLASLQREFESNLQQVERVAEVYRNSRERMTALQGLSDEQIRGLPQTEVSQHMFAMCIPWTFDPVLGTTNALVGAGKLGVLSDPELRSALTTFVSLAEDADDEVIYLQGFAREIWRAQIPHGGPWTDPGVEEGVAGAIRGLDFIPKATPDDLLALRTDRLTMGLVANFHLSGAYYETDLGHVRTEIQRILKLIAQGL